MNICIKSCVSAFSRLESSDHFILLEPCICTIFHGNPLNSCWDISGSMWWIKDMLWIQFTVGNFNSWRIFQCIFDFIVSVYKGICLCVLGWIVFWIRLIIHEKQYVPSHIIYNNIFSHRHTHTHIYLCIHMICHLLN